MSYTVTDDEKERLYNEYGKPPKRDEPLSLQRDMMVYVCDIGGPLYGLEKGRVFGTGLTHEEVRRKKGMATDSGTIEGDESDTYVNVRYGPATMETCYVPEQYVVEIIADECRWDADKRGYVPV